YPLVAKVVSQQVVHKSDAGGVVTDIRSEEELLEAYDSIHHHVKEQHKEAEIEGVLLQQMLKQGTEFIIGARYSNTYGHLLMFGVGGIFVEVLKDVTFRRVPVSRSDARSMIAGIRAKKLLEGVRGKPAVDKEALADTLLRLSQLVQDFPQVKELDINPVFGFQDKAVVADARVIVR
ncbi:MAG: acetate--CoA ligase family protein, partial [Hymenobacteraceae bacterium]|nr:acetate--CoA ligase family protein [Hymenobacteraceae bacterium]